MKGTVKAACLDRPSAFAAWSSSSEYSSAVKCRSNNGRTSTSSKSRCVSMRIASSRQLAGERRGDAAGDQLLHLGGDGRHQLVEPLVVGIGAADELGGHRGPLDQRGEHDVVLDRVVGQHLAREALPVAGEGLGAAPVGGLEIGGGHGQRMGPTPEGGVDCVVVGQIGRGGHGFLLGYGITITRAGCGPLVARLRPSAGARESRSRVSVPPDPVRLMGDSREGRAS